jgi:hypothetical protein
MPNVITNPNLWTGEYVTGLNRKTILGSDTVVSNLWRVEQGFESTAIFKLSNYTSRLAVGDRCSVTPGVSSSMSDLAVTLSTYVIKDVICKDSFNNTNYAMYLQKGVFNKEIPKDVLEAFIEDMILTETVNLELIRWSGDVASATAPRNLQDGIVKKIKASAGYVQVVPTTATASRTAGTVINEINKVLKATPSAVRYSPNFKLVISPAVFSAYQEAMTLNPSGAMFALWGNSALQNMQTGSPAYIGNFVNSTIPMYLATGLDLYNDEVILAGVLTNDTKGNLLYVTDAISDQSQISVVDRQLTNNNDANIDILWSFRQGIAICRPSEIVLYHN